MLRLTLVVALVVQTAVLQTAVLQTAPENEPALVLYQPPMANAVVDPFRPPAHIGAPGNRGLQYGLSENHGVRAAATGQVVFAGQVGVRRVITVRHGDGVRTTYTGLRDIRVSRGEYVSAGQTMAIAIARFHFGARLGDHYLDPQILFDASELQERPRLLPAPD